MTESPVAEARPDARSAIVSAAADLLRTSGARAVTTRAVAEKAGVPAPTIFRLFGDKDGLLEAVAERVLADHVATKAVKATEENGDPVEDLKAAWHAQIAFNLANPSVFTLLTSPDRLRRSSAAGAGLEVLRARVARVAAAGLLKVTEERAADMIQAAGNGAVLVLLSEPEDQRDPQLADAMLQAVLREITTSEPATEPAGPIAIAVAFRAALHELPSLSEAERTLLSEWLTRTTADLQNSRSR